MINRHSAVAQAAYADLLRSLRDETASELRGAPTRVERGARAYWYDSYRIGSEVKKRYVGEDTPELRDRLSRAGAARAGTKERKTHRTRLIRILRAEGFLGIDAGAGSLLAALAASGVFRLGGTLVGTYAFRLYEGLLGLRYAFDETAQTGDVDIACFERLSLALEDVASPPVADVLGDFSFAPVPGVGERRSWKWRQTQSDLLVEFLTPSFDGKEDRRPLAALGVDAQALHHLNYLIAEPEAAAVPYRSGVLVQVPRPERFAIHKLIVADRRREGPESFKSRKDRVQAAFLIRALSEDRPEDLGEALEDAVARGPRWRLRIERSLARMPETKTLLGGL